MDLLQQAQQILNEVATYFQSGFYSVNAVQGLLIAAISAYYLSDIRRLFVIALGAVIVHAMIDVMIPILGGRGALKLPPLVEVEYWRHLLQLYAGYLIVISVFYVVKRLMARSGGGAAH
jgi:hypothetical protein